MVVNKDTFCIHFWDASRLKKISESTKNERYEDFQASNMSLGKYIVYHSRTRPGMLVKIKRVFERGLAEDFEDGDLAIYIDSIHEHRAGEKWFKILHGGEIKEILDIELEEVLIDSL
ncbi:hypothetical protein CL634_10310 [bacterium]|nr:hypothetical protein [bacterium]|tara:strand:- start:301 stop:651 length:351 start_codon:yes stop_codon:yes gene_type:complete